MDVEVSRVTRIKEAKTGLGANGINEGKLKGGQDSMERLEGGNL